MDRTDAQQLAEQMASAWMQRDVPAIGSLFTDDGEFITPKAAVRGRAAIEAAARKFFEQPLAVTVTISRVLVDGSQGAVEWIWQETDTTTGTSRTMEDAIIFTVRDGKLAYWREYFDPAQTEKL
jgi:uncharacterized protein (TIGR02246 family)